ncbi:MAG: hypothetical protein LBD16_02715 [Oscillospiraceae bacterium]|jgi:hypothetical protein|nr:hypothetical protein [Oscillospiraceae bacterium]
MTQTKSSRLLTAPANARAADDLNDAACSAYVKALIDTVKSSGDMENALSLLMQLSAAINGGAGSGAANGGTGSGGAGTGSGGADMGDGFMDCTIDSLIGSGSASEALAEQLKQIEETLSGSLDASITALLQFRELLLCPTVTP